MTKMERRTFLKSATAVSAFTILKPGTAFGTKANSAIRMGIIGCGGRGTGVISSMSKNTNIAIIAMADLLDEKLQKTLVTLNKVNSEKGYPEILKTNMYKGSKAYLQLLNNKEVDAVLISTPAYAHPEFLEAAVAAGKHAYCEKPAAIDVEGCKRVQKIAAGIHGKLSAVHGFQIRYASPFIEMINRLQQGAIGDIVNVQLYYLSSGVGISPINNISFDEYRIRNHYHFHAISGGTLLDQGIHILDVCNWVLQSHPIQAIGTGGSKAGAEFGDAWNNYQIIYEYPDNISVSIHTTQVGPEFGDVCARFIGSKGIAEAHYSGGVFISGDNPWDSGVLRCGASIPTEEQKKAGVFLSALQDADANKEIAFIKSIETGNYLNQLETGCESTLTALLGREAAIRHETISWDELILSGERIDPNLDLSQFDK
ncbi:MAG: Gfo/Idh/MocA family oxidoreductase [Bacteroidota bacterium]